MLELMLEIVLIVFSITNEAKTFQNVLGSFCSEMKIVAKYEKDKSNLV